MITLITLKNCWKSRICSQGCLLNENLRYWLYFSVLPTPLSGLELVFGRLCLAPLHLLVFPPSPKFHHHSRRGHWHVVFVRKQGKIYQTITMFYYDVSSNETCKNISTGIRVAFYERLGDINCLIKSYLLCCLIDSDSYLWHLCEHKWNQ